MEGREREREREEKMDLNASCRMMGGAGDNKAALNDGIESLPCLDISGHQALGQRKDTNGT